MRFPTIALAGVGVLIGLAIGQARADSAPVVLDLEGNPTCKSLTTNTISEVRLTKAVDGTYGPTNQRIAVTFATSPAPQVANFSAGGAPINFVIVKGAGASGGRVYHYGAGGIATDDELASPKGAAIAAVSFCYGLTSSAPPPAATLKSCTQVSGTVCQPGVTPPYVIYKVNTGGALFASELCQCNFALTRCNADDPNAPNACVKVDGMPGTLREMPQELLGINTGTVFCQVIGGRRLCYNR
jgi:hypothetical protein